MNRVTAIIVGISAAVVMALVIGIWIAMVGALASYPLGKAVFVVILTVVVVGPAVWVGLRIGNRLATQNREYVEQHRKRDG